MLIAKPSQLVSTHLPSHYSEEYPKFVMFIKTFWQFLEQRGYAVDVIINQQSYDDIDRTLTEYIPYFKKQYAEFFPDTALIDKRLLIKHIKDFYLSKGSEDAFKMFFQMLYGIEAEVFYPAAHMLRASDGVWEKKIICRVSRHVGDPFGFSGQVINFSDGTNVIKSVFCETVQMFTTGSYLVYELLLKNSDVDFTYLDIDNATIVESNGIEAILYKMVVDTVVTIGGTGYQTGDTGRVTGGGSGAKIAVKNVDPITGAITSIEMIDFGVNYSGNDIFNFVWGTNNLVWVHSGTTYQMVVTTSVKAVFDTTGDTTAEGALILGKMAIYSQKYSGSSGWLSSDMKLQDNYFYQIHSYEINSNKSINTWIDTVKDNAHIAGTKAFGKISLNNTHQVN